MIKTSDFSHRGLKRRILKVPILDPLLTILNRSVDSGEFPKNWKEALITPVLKKGGVDDMSNYRPVSCLPAASKLLEKIVCEQLSEYFEKNGLLPKSQHGFDEFSMIIFGAM